MFNGFALNVFNVFVEFLFCSSLTQSYLRYKEGCLIFPFQKKNKIDIYSHVSKIEISAMQLKKSSFNFKSSFVCIVLSFMITTYRYILLLMWSQSCVQFEELAVASLQVLIISLVFSDIKTQWTSL